MAKNSHPVPALFAHFGVDSVKPSDEFTVTYRDGILEASVKRRSGKIETFSQTVSGSGFNQMTNFDPSDMGQAERNDLIKKLYKNGRGESQSSLGRKFGLTQAQISRIVRS